MLSSLRELARTLLSLTVTRARLAATEIEEQALRAVEIFIWIALALLLLGITLVFGAVMVVLLFWDSDRLLATGLLAGGFATACAAAAWFAYSCIRERPPLLEQTLAELERDHDALRQS